MKYPPVCSTHWEGAVGQWLRGQLDARGIDAPAYGRYVLSLLTRPLDPADLSPSPIGNKVWDRRKQCDWPPVKIEALKRSAAVQCLLNASDDQNSGIEQLVDELCLKLKEVEEINAQNKRRDIQAVRATRKERTRQLSPAEMARLYYAAFPALVPSASNNDNLTEITKSGMSYRTKNFLSHKHNPNSKDFGQSKKQYGTKERRNNMHTHRSHNRNNRHKNIHSKNHNQTEELPEWVNNGYEWDIETQDQIKEELAKNDIFDNEDVGHDITNEVPSAKECCEHESDYLLNVDDLIISKHWLFEENLQSPQKSPAEEESIAKFKAKFDSSLEALWPKEQNNNVDFELPIDFHDIISPSEKMFDGFSTEKLCTASLSNSIWSNNSKLDCDKNDIILIDGNFQSQKSNSDFDTASFFNNNFDQEKSELYNKESMELIYSKLKPLNLDDNSESSFDIKQSQWDLASIKSSESNTYPIIFGESHTILLDTHNLPFESPVRSFNILNHSSSCSSFTEVVPKASSGFVGDNLKRKLNTNLNLDVNKQLLDNEINDKDEEDLLTSMKTHFRPIKHDNSNDSTHAAVNYIDGMTFPIVSDLDHVKFNRSTSGTLFLESDTEPPKQYMEYRKQGIDYSRLDISSSSICSDEGLTSTDLVLKFRVCQTEKSVQTDEDLTSPKKIQCVTKFPKKSEISSELSILSSDMDVVCSKSDCILDIDNEMETLCIEWVQCEECKLNNNQWIAKNWHPLSLNSSKIWSLDDDFCKACSEQQAKARKKKFDSDKNKIHEEECAREWDELLSDLRYIHDFRTENEWREEQDTPIDNCYIGPTEISFCATDGNFIKSALLSQESDTNIFKDVKAWLADTNDKIESNAVGRILDQSMLIYSNVEPHCDLCSQDTLKTNDLEEGWRIDRKRRHSAVNNGRIKGVIKLRCTLPAAAAAVHSTLSSHLPLLPTADRPLTR